MNQKPCPSSACPAVLSAGWYFIQWRLSSQKITFKSPSLTAQACPCSRACTIFLQARRTALRVKSCSRPRESTQLYHRLDCGGVANPFFLVSTSSTLSSLPERRLPPPESRTIRKRRILNAGTVARPGDVGAWPARLAGGSGSCNLRPDMRRQDTSEPRGWLPRPRRR